MPKMLRNKCPKTAQKLPKMPKMPKKNCPKLGSFWAKLPNAESHAIIGFSR